MSVISKDHGYSRLAALQQACDEDDIDWTEHGLQEEKTMEVATNDSPQMGRQHTPIKSPHPKKKKKSPNEPQVLDNGENDGGDDVSNSALFAVIMKLSCKLDVQGEQLLAMDWRFQENTEAVLKVKESVDSNTNAVKKLSEEVTLLKSQMTALQGENAALKEMCLEHARYKRRWNLRLNGVPEKEGENIRGEVVNILKEIIPASQEQLEYAVDTVHRLGQKKGTNDRPRQVIMQFAQRTVRDLVWQMSKDARICKERNIHFKQDFCKEDRESRARLYPRVAEAKKRGIKAYLKEGYAVINGRIVKD